MRLKTIKLNGFKTFSEPAALQLRSNLVAIVGPNGCGKSNVVDAIRWVLGESSARQLRGDSMSDVIFNGTSGRHPLGQASVELVFENTLGKLGGVYATYQEISIKRQLTREGQSAYFLNGARCRRKDVTDIFLGTGLGPRSYSIIEQGMISRIIDARPEELRGYIEEAAGISRYRERRKETDNRIAHTRDNLARVNDLRSELQRQQQTLERQSRNAEKYKELAEQERLHKGHLLVLRIRQHLESGKVDQQKIALAETGLQRFIAEQRSLEAEMEKGRILQQQAGDGLSQVQADYYALGAELSTAQKMQELANLEKQRLVGEREGLMGALQQTLADREGVDRRIQAVVQLYEEVSQAQAGAKDSHDLIGQKLQEARERVATIEKEQAEFQQQLQRPRLDQIEYGNLIGQLQTRMEGARQRLEALQADQEHEQMEQWRASLVLAEARMDEMHKAREALDRAVSAADQEASGYRQQLSAVQQEKAQLYGGLQLNQGKIDSLREWQRSVVADSQAVEVWLRQQKLETAPKLGLTLQVDPDWQQAVELLLGTMLSAVGVDDLGTLLPNLANMAGTGLLLAELGDSRIKPVESPPKGSDGGSESGCLNLPPVTNYVRGPWHLTDQLYGIYAADSLQQAIAYRGKLAPGQSLITADGLWVGSSWLRTLNLEEEKRLFDSNRQLDDLQQTRAKLIGEEQEVQICEQQIKSQLEGAQELLRKAQGQRQQALSNWAEVNTELNVIRAHISRGEDRLNRLADETVQLTELMASDQKTVQDARQKHDVARGLLQKLTVGSEELEARVSAAKTELAKTQSRFEESRERLHQLAMRLQQVSSEKGELQRNLVRAQEQEKAEQQRLQKIDTALKQGEEPLVNREKQLQELLGQRGKSEVLLKNAREKQQLCEQQIRNLDSKRLNNDRQSQQQRQALEALRISYQESQTLANGLKEQLEQLNIDYSVALSDLPTNIREDEVREELAKLGLKISRLGPVNLAAIDEFEQLQKRKDYLDQQYADLEEALATMERAMQKMDRETRTQFKDTFDKINQGLKRHFPRLFGGGHAYLDLLGDEALDAGITIMAQPPGKKNTSIQQLSGGEKALTAISFVFSIFELNPAPFCVLDEVDAPLDDVNVGRFSSLVSEMSNQVQFIFVTHNKGTMEIAHQLTGVTMAEVGVSRLVAVDIDEAIKLTEATA